MPPAGGLSPAPAGIYASRHFLHWVWIWYMGCTYEWQMWYNSLPVFQQEELGCLSGQQQRRNCSPQIIWELNFAINHKGLEMFSPSPGDSSDKTVAPIYTSLQPVRVPEADDPAHPGWTPCSQTGWVLISVHWLRHMTNTHGWANKNMLLWTVNQLSDVLPLWNTNLIHQKLLLSEEDMFNSGQLSADSRKEKAALEGT